MYQEVNINNKTHRGSTEAAHDLAENTLKLNFKISYLRIDIHIFKIIL